MDWDRVNGVVVGTILAMVIAATLVHLLAPGIVR